MAAPTLTNEAITPKSLYTITGAAAAVWLFGAVLYTVLGQRVDEVIYRSIAFGLSLIIAIGMLIEKKTYKLKYWLLIIPNSALIFVNASGYNAVNTGSFDAPGVASEKVNSANNVSIPPGEIGSIQKASILPFLKDIAWWPDPQLKEKVDALEETNDSLKSENKILLQKKGGLSASDSMEVINNKNKIAAMDVQIQALQLENTTLKSGNKDIPDFSSTIQNLNNTINSLRRQLTDKDNQLRNVTNQLAQSKSDLASTNQKLQDCLKKPSTDGSNDDKLTSVLSQLDQNKRSLTACENKLRDAESTIQSLNNQLKNCTGNTDATSTIKDLQTKIRSLENELSTVRGQLSNCQAALAKSGNTGNTSNLQNQITDLQNRLNSCQGQLEKNNSALNSYYYQLRAVRDSLSNCLKPKISKTATKIGGK